MRLWAAPASQHCVIEKRVSLSNFSVIWYLRIAMCLFPGSQTDPLRLLALLPRPPQKGTDGKIVSFYFIWWRGFPCRKNVYFEPLFYTVPFYKSMDYTVNSWETILFYLSLGWTKCVTPRSHHASWYQVGTGTIPDRYQVALNHRSQWSCSHPG